MAQSKECIFIGIASYCDTQLQSTLMSLLYHCNKKENIGISVAWQGNFESSSHSLNLSELKACYKGNYSSFTQNTNEVNCLATCANEKEISNGKPCNYKYTLQNFPIWVENELHQGNNIEYLSYLKINTASEAIRLNGIEFVEILPVLHIPLNKQKEDEKALKLENSKEYRSYLRIICMDYKNSKGPNYARYLCQLMYNKEDYFLQLDSHMRFIPNWDLNLLKELHLCYELTSFEPILTTYPSNYDESMDYWAYPKNECPTVLTASHFNDQGFLLIKGRKLKENYSKPIPCFFWASGFSFSSANVIEKVPYDKDLQFIFFGEEQAMWIRLFSNGYDFFCPSKVIVFHLWHRLTPNSKFNHLPIISSSKELLPNNSNSNNEQAYYYSYQKINNLLNFSDNLNTFSKKKLGIGSNRLVSEFWQRCHVNLSLRHISIQAFSGSPNLFLPFKTHNISSLQAYATYRKWLSGKSTAQSYF